MSGATRTIARNTVVQAAADILGKVATLAFYVVMARELGSTGSATSRSRCRWRSC